MFVHRGGPESEALGSEQSGVVDITWANTVEMQKSAVQISDLKYQIRNLATGFSNPFHVKPICARLERTNTFHVKRAWPTDPMFRKSSPLST